MDEATKKLIADSIKDATKGLKDKNKELLGLLSHEKGKHNQLATSLHGLDLEQLKKDSKALASMTKKKQEKDGEYKTLYEQQQAQHQEAIDKVTAEKKDAQDALQSVKKASALSNAVRAAHVDPLLHDAAIALHESTIALNDAGEAMIGDKTVNAAVKDWTETDVGKRFVSDGHSGGDGNGPGGKVESDAAYFDKKSPHFNVTKQAAVARKSPELYQKLKKQAAV